VAMKCLDMHGNTVALYCTYLIPIFILIYVSLRTKPSKGRMNILLVLCHILCTYIKIMRN
jgi:hypothetical protein